MEPTATKNGEDGQLPENAKKECPVEASRETGQADKQPASTEPAPPNTKSAIDIAGDPAASVVAPPKIDSVCSSNTSAPAEKQAEPSSDTEPSSRKRQAEDRDEVQKSDIDSIASKKTKVSESYDPESALEDETAATQTSAPVELGEHSMQTPKYLFFPPRSNNCFIFGTLYSVYLITFTLLFILWHSMGDRYA